MNSLSAPCDTCGAPEGALVYASEHSREFRCPACSQEVAIFQAAYDHLKMLLTQAVRTWMLTWGAAPNVVFNVQDGAPEMLSELFEAQR